MKENKKSLQDLNDNIVLLNVALKQPGLDAETTQRLEAELNQNIKELEELIGI